MASANKTPQVGADFGGEGNLSVEARLAAESDAIEAAEAETPEDAPLPGNVKLTRGHGRSKVLQIRLNDEELIELERISSTRGLPTSTVAREAILRYLFPEQTRQIEGKRLADEVRRFVAEFVHRESVAERQRTNAMVTVDAPMSILPTPTNARPDVAKRVDEFWAVLRNAFAHGGEATGEHFLPGGLAPTGAQVMPDGTVFVFAEPDEDGHRAGFIVPNVRAKTS